MFPEEWGPDLVPYMTDTGGVSEVRSVQEALQCVGEFWH